MLEIHIILVDASAGHRGVWNVHSALVSFVVLSCPSLGEVEGGMVGHAAQTDSVAHRLEVRVTVVTLPATGPSSDGEPMDVDDPDTPMLDESGGGPSHLEDDAMDTSQDL